MLKERGPMTGMLSVLFSTGRSQIFFVACDMPFIRPELIRYMVDKYRAENKELRTQNTDKGNPAPGSEQSWDAVIPLLDKTPQPLCGIYSSSVIKTMERRIDEGEKSLTRCMEELNVLYIGEDEVKAVDPEGKSFTNINTMEDYEKIVGSQQSVVKG